MSKHDFIKWCKAFFVDVEWTDAMERKLDYAVSQVVQVKEVVKIVEKPIIREKLVRVRDTQTHIQRVDRYVNDAYLRFQKEEGVKEVFVKKSLLDIAEDVCLRHNITVDQLKSSIRRRNLVDARTCFIQHAMCVYPYTTVEIAEFLNRNHATIIYHKKGRSKSPYRMLSTNVKEKHLLLSR